MTHRRHDNPNFACDAATVENERRRMRADPRPLGRPVVVLAGWRSFRLPAFGLADKLAPLTSGRRTDFIAIAYPWAGSVEAAAGHARRVLTETFQAAGAGQQGPDPVAPVEVDVVGISMGGLVGRLLEVRSALADPGPVRIRRLFTIATPHGGARLADRIALDRAARSMRAGSTLLRDLEAGTAESRYELICYAQLRDWWVGATRSSPAAGTMHWIDAESPMDRALSHFTSFRRWPIVLDIARRLRGESPLAGVPSRPPRD